jgi:hypothetical protein
VASPEANSKETKHSQSSAINGCRLIFLAWYLNTTTTISKASRHDITPTIPTGAWIAVNILKLGDLGYLGEREIQGQKSRSDLQDDKSFV